MLRSSLRPPLALVLLALSGACASNSSSTTPPPDAGPGPTPPPPLPPLAPAIFVDRSPAAADGRDGVVVTVVARDASGNPLSGAAVQFDPGGATIARSMATTDANGVAVAVITSTTPRTTHVTATTPVGVLTADATFTKGAWGKLTSGMLGAPIIDLTADPFRPSSLRGAAGGNGGGFQIVESHNGGLTFTTRDPSDASDPIRVAFAPRRRDLEFGVTRDGCFVRSTDGGATFQELRCDAIAGPWVAPSDPQVLYAGARNGFGGKLVRSTNGGDAWEDVGDLPDTNTIVVAPDDAQTLVAQWTKRVDLKRSTDGGRTWTAIDGPLKALKEETEDIAVASSKVIYATVNINSYRALGGRIGLVATTDGGATWSTPADPQGVLSALDPPGIPYTTLREAGIVVNPLDASTIYLQGTSTLRSRDGGATWEPMSRFGFAFDPHDARRLIALATGERTTDGGDTWSAPLYPAGRDTIPDLYTVIASPDRVYTAFMNAGCYVSVDGGGSWTASGLDGCDWYESSAAALGDGTLLIVGDGRRSGLQRSTDFGKTWTRVSMAPGVPNGLDGVAAAAAPDEPSTAYVVTGTGVAFTSDGGQTWSFLTVPSPPMNDELFHVDAGPKGALVIVSRSGSAWVGTRNGGFTPFGSSFVDCSISPIDAKTILCLQANGGTSKSVVRSADGGKTLTTVIDGLDQQTSLVPVFALDGSAAFVRDAKGISRSVDGGATWTHVADLPAMLPTTFLTIGLAAESATVLYAGQYRIELPAP